MEFHPAANLFPLMGEAELAELAADIREHGLHHPVTLHEGKILDGRNRWLACRKVEVEPRFETWNGQGSPTAWVISENARRRHLTVSQLAAVAIDALPLFAEEAKLNQAAAAVCTNTKLGRETHSLDLGEASPSGKKAVQRAVEAVGGGVSRATAEKAKAVGRYAPDLFEEVRAGQVSVDKAYKEVQSRGLLIPQTKKRRARGVAVQNGRIVHLPKPIPELDELPPMVAAFIREFEQGLPLELGQKYCALALPEWERVVLLLRRRLCNLFEGKALTSRRVTATGAAESGRNGVSK